MKRAILIGTVVLVGGASALLSLPRQESFPHARHQGLFPTCTACHAGIESGDASQFVSVQPATCQACHDGQTAPRVSWDGPGEPEATNRRSVHPGHPQLPCGTCHQVPGTSEEMQVRAASFDNCMVCHAPGAEGHRDEDNDCYQCHLPLTEATGITTAQIAAFTRPPSHSTPEFISTHGATANEDAMSCSVCHARENCELCHVNAENVAAIMALGTDPRVASLMEGKTWDPPIPGSHYVDEWDFAHGPAMAESSTSCAVCHTQEVCSTCHVDTYEMIAGDFTTAAAATPEDLSITIPGHSPNFAVAHGQAAVSATPKCSACHFESYCVDCHDGSGRPSFHPTDFVQRHGAEVAAQLQTCSECHSNEVFCRDCHSTQGFAVADQTGAAFHDATPDWFMAHGKAARQGLDGCASCHSQTSCLRCHSAVEGFRINPHGPDFDADAELAKGSCTICHGTAPGGGSR